MMRLQHQNVVEKVAWSQDSTENSVTEIKSIVGEFGFLTQQRHHHSVRGNSFFFLSHRGHERSASRCCSDQLISKGCIS